MSAKATKKVKNNVHQIVRVNTAPQTTHRKDLHWRQIIDRPVQPHQMVSLLNPVTNQPELFLVIDIPGEFRRRIGPFFDEDEINRFLGRLFAYDPLGDFLCELRNEMQGFNDTMAYCAREVIEDGCQPIP